MAVSLASVPLLVKKDLVRRSPGVSDAIFFASAACGSVTNTVETCCRGSTWAWMARFTRSLLRLGAFSRPRGGRSRIGTAGQYRLEPGCAPLRTACHCSGYCRRQGYGTATQACRSGGFVDG